MTMTSSGQIMSWPDYLKTKRNMNIKLRDLCETLIVYILLITFQLVQMVLTVNKPHVRRFIAWIESADWTPWPSKMQSNTSHLKMVHYLSWSYVSLQSISKQRRPCISIISCSVLWQANIILVDIPEQITPVPGILPLCGTLFVVMIYA